MSEIRPSIFVPGRVIGPKYTFCYRITEQRNYRKASLTIECKEGPHPARLEIFDNSADGRLPMTVLYHLWIYNEGVATFEWHKMSESTPVALFNIEVVPHWRRKGIAILLGNIALSDILSLGFDIRGIRTSHTLGHSTSFPHAINALLARHGGEPDKSVVHNILKTLREYGGYQLITTIYQTEGEMAIPSMQIRFKRQPESARLFLTDENGNYVTDRAIYENIARNPEEIARRIESGRAHLGVPYVLPESFINQLTQYGKALPRFIDAPVIPSKV